MRLNRKDGIGKVAGTLFCVAGASVITLYKGPTIYSPVPPLNSINGGSSISSLGLGDAKGKNWTLGCLYLIGHCLSWSGWLVLQAPVLKKYPARLSVTSYTCFFGLIQFLIIALILERDTQAWIFQSGGEVFTILYAVSINFYYNLICHMSRNFDSNVAFFYDIKICSAFFFRKSNMCPEIYYFVRKQHCFFLSFRKEKC